MSIWDDGFKMPNVECKTMGGEVFWDNIEETDEYRLQKNSVFGNCRILKPDNTRIDYGTESSMRAKFRQLTNKINHAVKGDVICVHRLAGMYDHYGVYEDDEHVYEYNLNKKNARIDIHVVTLEEFSDKRNGYSVLNFPEFNGVPDKIDISTLKKNFLGGHLSVIDDDNMNKLVKMIAGLRNSDSEYHLYSPEETIKRAKSKLGEHEYSLFFNNCEHYAIWCKTGLSKSHQIEGLLSGLNDIIKISDALSEIE